MCSLTGTLLSECINSALVAKKQKYQQTSKKTLDPPKHFVPYLETRIRLRKRQKIVTVFGFGWFVFFLRMSQSYAALPQKCFVWTRKSPVFKVPRKVIPYMAEAVGFMLESCGLLCFAHPSGVHGQHWRLLSKNPTLPPANGHMDSTGEVHTWMMHTALPCSVRLGRGATAAGTRPSGTAPSWPPREVRQTLLVILHRLGATWLQALTDCSGCCFFTPKSSGLFLPVLEE